MPLGLKRIVFSILLISGIILSSLGLLDKGLDWVGLHRLDRTNQRYLEEGFEKALTGFMILSGIKSGLAIIEGSEVGVGFNLQIGDVVQPLYDYVDIAWRAALTGGSIIVIMQFALQGLNMMDHWVLSFLLILILFLLFLVWWRPDWKQPRQFLKQTSRFFLMLCLALYLMLPLAVTAAAVLSHQITEPVIEDTHAQLRELRDNLSPERINRRFLGGSEDTGLMLFDLKNRLTTAGQGITALVNYLKKTTEKLAALTIKLIAAYVFDCIIFPMFFGLIFMTLMKSGVGYLFDLKRS